MEIIIITILAIFCAVLLIVAVYLYLVAYVGEEMIESKDKMILFYRENAKQSDMQVLNRLQKIQEALKKE